MSESSKWPHVVAIVSIIAASLSSAHSTWSSNNLKIELENVKNSFARMEAQRLEKARKVTDRCKSITLVATDLAKSKGETYTNVSNNFDKRSEIRANLWAAATLLSQENKREFLDFYAQGPKNDDKYEVDFELKLIEIALRGLALDSQRCATL